MAADVQKELHGFVALNGGRSFFFQAEDGIRDADVTGVQTCALPICPARRTRETLEAMAEALPENSLKQRLRLDEALYTFDGEALRAWLQALPEGSRRVLVVGHNPALLELARWLSPQAPEALPTGALLHLSLRGESWRALERHAAERLVSLTPEQASHGLFLRRAPVPEPVEKGSGAESLQGRLDHLYRRVRAPGPGGPARRSEEGRGGEGGG